MARELGKRGDDLRKSIRQDCQDCIGEENRMQNGIPNLGDGLGFDFRVGIGSGFGIAIAIVILIQEYCGSRSTRGRRRGRVLEYGATRLA